MSRKKKSVPILVVIAIIAAILVFLGLGFGLGIGTGGKGEKEGAKPPPKPAEVKDGVMVVKVSGTHNDLRISVDGKQMKDADEIIKAARDKGSRSIMIQYHDDPSRDKVHELYRELKSKVKKQGIIVYQPEKAPE